MGRSSSEGYVGKGDCDVTGFRLSFDGAGQTGLRRATVQQVFEGHEAVKVHWSQLWALVALGAIC